MTAKILRAGVEDGILFIIGEGFDFFLKDIIRAERYSRKIGCKGFFIDKIRPYSSITFSNRGKYMATLKINGQFAITVDPRNDPKAAVEAIEEDVQNRLVDS
jgi:hypothetical protein